MAENISNKIRSYEVSIWTLQDRFLSVLKWAEMDCKGQIQEPEVVLRDDGTEEFTFSIPQYYYNGATRIANPMWLHLENQPLEANMHKLKIVFNKHTEDEKILEFLVVSVDNVHESDNVMISVKCEGLAFHELGKVGYKVALSEQNYIDRLEEWEASGFQGDQPLNDIKFWNDLLFKLSYNGNTYNKTNWIYELQMNYDSYSAKTKEDEQQLYEDEYVSSWDTDLNPRTLVGTKVKCRIIDTKESNLYNITQTIAEEFGVFCRYEYEHDDHYQITGRKVIYYNNYYYDKDGQSCIDLTYPYSATSITRTVDNSEVTTKMFVQSVDYNSDLVTIMGIDANKSGEDYLLNFDYMHEIQAITDEQYDEVAVFEKRMHKLNDEIVKIQDQIRACENQLTDAKARQTTYNTSLEQATSRMNLAIDARTQFTDGNNSFPIDGVPCVVMQSDTLGWYMNIRWDGLERDSVRLYTEINSSATGADRYTKVAPIYSFGVVEDEFHNVIQLKQIAVPDGFSGNTLWVRGFYNPVLAYDKIAEVWKRRIAYDKKELAKANQDVAKFEYYLNGGEKPDHVSNSEPSNLIQKEKEKIAEKVKLISDFEKMMGPALREGYWNPENYHDYGDLYYADFQKTDKTGENTTSKITSILKKSSTPTPHLELKWDSEKYYDNEEELIYDAGVDGSKEHHLVINLTNYLSTIYSHSDRLNDLCFVYKDPLVVSMVAALKDSNLKNKAGNSAFNDLDAATKNTWIASLEKYQYRYFQLNSGCELGWVKDTAGNIIPSLIVTGAKEWDADTYQYVRTGTITTHNINYNTERIELNEINTTAFTCFLGFITTNEAQEITWEYRRTSTATTAFTFLDTDTSRIVNNNTPYSYVRVYPRLYFDSLKLKHDALTIYKNGTKLENFQDYETIADERYENENITGVGYYTTIKPHSLFSSASLNLHVVYSLSNLDVAIYLDAIKVMNENARPKVSYNIDLSVLNPNFIHTAYNRLNQIVHINDLDLKLDYVSGYISTVTMKLDKCWEDTVEIKNYETKFEDLFSTIVAQSEAMKRNGGVLSSLADGNLYLSPEAFENLFKNNKSLFQDIFNEHYIESPIVEARLRELFTEAGQILGESGNLLNQVATSTVKNASILSGFVQDIATELTPKTYYSEDQPTTYKVGDIWVQLDTENNEIGRYVATSDSSQSGDAAYGWTRTYDGTLAAIRGAGLEIDAVNGTSSLYAENRLNITSGGNLYIAADDRVDIVGNKSVNIGGTTINIGSVSSTNKKVGGINLVASAYNTVGSNKTSASLSKVLISPTQIELGSANILMRGENAIQLITSRNSIESTSALSLDPKNGIWMGSGKGITLYSGNVKLTYNSTSKLYEIDSGTGASVKILPTCMTFGVTDGEDGTAIKMTKSYILLGAGNIVNGDTVNDDTTPDVTGISTGLIGAKFTKNSIGLATSSGSGSATVINAILMNNNGITLGSGLIDTENKEISLTKASNVLRAAKAGTYIRISPGMFEIGSRGHMWIDTANVKIQTSASGALFAVANDLSTGEGKTFQNGLTYNTNAATLQTWAGTTGKHGLIYNNNGLFISGNLYALGGTIGGWTIQDGWLAGDDIVLVSKNTNDGITINNTSGYHSGIYLTNSDNAVSTLSVKYKNKTYYAYHMSGNIDTNYYLLTKLKNGKPNPETITYGTNYSGPVLARQQVLISVSPKGVYKEVIGVNGKVYDDDTASTTEEYELYDYTKYYIATEDNSCITYGSSRTRIEYDGSSSPDAEWFQILTNYKSKLYNEDTGNKITYSNAYNAIISSDELTETTVANGTEFSAVTQEIKFRIQAYDGDMRVHKGILGNLTLSEKGLSDGTLTNTTLNSCTIDNYSSAYYGSCFKDIRVDGQAGTIILTRIDDTELTIDIAGMEKIKELTSSYAVASDSAQQSDSSTVYCSSCTGTCKNGCTEGCSFTCSGQCKGTCGKQCASDCTGGCKTNCTGDCTGACYGTCGETCMSGCTGGCTGNCNTTCRKECANTCAATCATGCRNSCVAGCAQNIN